MSTAWVLDRLTTAPGNPALAVHDGQVKKGSAGPPYVVVYFSVLSPSGQLEPQKVSLEAAYDWLDVSAYCHCVGVDAAAARSVAARVASRLLNAVPQVPGRDCTPVWHDDGQPPTRDETTGVPVFDQVDVYRFQSYPA